MYLDKAEEWKLKLIFYICYFLYLYSTNLLIFFNSEIHWSKIPPVHTSVENELICFIHSKCEVPFISNTNIIVKLKTDGLDK